MDTQLREDIDWVGWVDWLVRDFHGYKTEHGSTYNAYLVRDEKSALIDTVKAPFAENLLTHVSDLLPLDQVDYVVCNHAEPDHSGSLPAVMRACTHAKLVCNKKCKLALERHFDTADWTWHIVSDGDTLSLGKRTLTFMDTPMVHWPESMFTYVPEEKLLFSMDAFGQHYSSSNRFDDEVPLDEVMVEAKTYFANIVMLYGKPIARVLERASEMEIEIIAPSHGVIWRKHLGTIVSAYQSWVAQEQKSKVLVVYDTMWQSTRLMAEAIMEGALSKGVNARLLNVRISHITELATEVLDAAALAVGSPTLNKTLMPSMAAALTYLKGLGPMGKCGFAFGSYGWSKGGAQDVERYLEEMKFDLTCEPIQCQFVPDAQALEACREAGRQLAAKVME